ncbi:hypothetical protein [Trichloromonas sp.]|uniref:hypothetical protein n=1 Tax=Trichloromonas sp. TaxID=3069249 RepID=UPI002A3D4B54|nr:hypothetical protein [Trichloromonas sp.]
MISVRRYLLLFTFLVLIFGTIIGPFSRHMGQKPYAEKLGLIPRSEVLKALFPDYQELVGTSILTKVFLYFGTLSEISNVRKLAQIADYPSMSRAVHAALQLDPYNMDGYYFGQAILSWDVGQHQLANELLEYGMKYRTWDWQLPFFAGFNYAYFLKDYDSAARMYMRAGELSGESLFTRLAGRYLQESGETRIAIDYLASLEKGARNPVIKKTFSVRIAAFEAVLAIEQARDRFSEAEGRLPDSIHELLKSGFLAEIPADPYGGTFYFDESGQVRSTSKFSFSTQSSNPASNPSTVPDSAE